MNQHEYLPAYRDGSTMAKRRLGGPIKQKRAFRSVVSVASFVCGCFLLYASKSGGFGSGGQELASSFQRFLTTWGICDTNFTHSHSFQYWEELYPPEEWGATVDAPPDTDVAFVVTIPYCPEDPNQPPNDSHSVPSHNFYDASAVLKHSVCEECEELDPNESSLSHTFYALIHPQAVVCTHHGIEYDRVKILTELGYFVKIWGEPVGQSQISSQYVRDNIGKDVGLRDLMKLHAWNLHTFPTVILVDYSTLIMKPLDYAVSAFQASDAEIAFTKEYAEPGTTATNLNTGLDTGLLMIKPGLVKHATLVETYKITDYDEQYGWNGSEEAPDIGANGGFKGVLGTSGFLAYYYRHQAASSKMLLATDSSHDAKCIYNNANEAPTENGLCRNGQETCTDCRADVQVTDIVAMRLNEYCGMPWDCSWDESLDIYSAPGKLCHHIHNVWTQKRKNFETSKWHNGPVTTADGTFKSATFGGYCDGTGGYKAMLQEASA